MTVEQSPGGSGPRHASSAEASAVGLFEEHTLPDPLPAPRLRVELRHKSMGRQRSTLGAGAEIVIGRGGPGVQVSLPWDKHASREHACVWVEGDRVFVRDLASHNGTYVDKAPIDGPVQLEPDSVLCVGMTRMRFVLDGAVANPEVAPRAEPERRRSPRRPTVTLAAPPPAPSAPAAAALSSRAAISTDGTRPPARRPVKHPALAVIGPFLEGMARRDLYGALALSPTCTEPEILERTRYLKEVFAEAQETLSEAQADRVRTALGLTEQAEEVLTEGRLDYDFLNGHARVAQRLRAAAKGGPSVEALHAAWGRTQVERVKTARLLFDQAQNARKRGSLPRAVELARSAAKDDPFNEEIRDRLQFWETLASARAP